ncbi:protein FAM170A-like [Heterocephalus glaber]|uniref:Protein FAM170A-like n=1 Tax=Heterocephalus glaber TaxID=10181 RepID=A0AAX6SFH5_HETGA|nr:protein FAM170A-like [Heterocephalus glaber]
MKHKKKEKHQEKKLFKRPVKKSRGTRRKLDLQDVLQGRAKVLAQTQGRKVVDSSSSTSVHFSYEDKFLDAELHNSPEDAAETHEMVPSSNLDAAENFSVSEHFPCIPSSSKCIPVDQDGPGSAQRLLNQDLTESKNFSFMEHSHLPSSLASNPSKSATSTEKKRVLKVYHKPVPMKRGMASLGDTEEDLEPLTKMTRRAKITFPEKIPSKASLSHMCLRDVLTDSENGLHGEGQEEREEAEKPPEHLAQGSVLEDPYSGFRCMVCCQVFPNMRLFKKHREDGVEGGASCLSLAFAKPRNTMKQSKRITEEEDRNMTTSGGDTEICFRFLLLLAFCAFLF